MAATNDLYYSVSSIVVASAKMRMLSMIEKSVCQQCEQTFKFLINSTENVNFGYIKRLFDLLFSTVTSLKLSANCEVHINNSLVEANTYFNFDGISRLEN